VDPNAPTSKPSFWGTTTGIITAIGGVLGAIAGLLGILASVGVIGQQDNPATNSQGNVLRDEVDCSQATHPEFETDERVFIIDGLRRDESYRGEYVVDEITKVRDWAYTEAAQYPSGTTRGYLLQFDGLQWNVRWEGDIGASPDQTGLPPIEASLLQSLLLCEAS
jgi:hypothetical protein